MGAIAVYFPIIITFNVFRIVHHEFKHTLDLFSSTRLSLGLNYACNMNHHRLPAHLLAIQTNSKTLKLSSFIQNQQNPLKEPLSFWVPANPLIIQGFFLYYTISKEISSRHSKNTMCQIAQIKAEILRNFAFNSIMTNQFHCWYVEEPFNF